MGKEELEKLTQEYIVSFPYGHSGALAKLVEDAVDAGFSVSALVFHLDTLREFQWLMLGNGIIPDVNDVYRAMVDDNMLKSNPFLVVFSLDYVLNADDRG